MEIYQLKYFVEVAKVENMNQVTRHSGISTPALSKAIQLLETELGIRLFDRVGKRIRLTEAGQLFQSRAIAILDLTKASTLGLAKAPPEFHVTLAGRELFLERIGLPFFRFLKRRYPSLQMEFTHCSGEDAIRSAANGTSDFALTTQIPPGDFARKEVLEFPMSVWAGKSHPIVKGTQTRFLGIEELLRQSFVAPNSSLFGSRARLASFDGWDDQRWPRRVAVTTSSVHLMVGIVKRGECLAYLPEFLGLEAGLVPIGIRGPMADQRLKVYLSTAKHKQLGWITNALDSFKLSR